MKRTAAALALLLLTATLAGCDTVEGPIEQSNRMSEYQHTLFDGRTVTCLAWRAGYAGGLSCDWANATPNPD